MRFFFPYHLIEQGSRIVLYGGGECGKDFWLQVHFSKWCNLVSWVDRSFDGYELKGPFGYISDVAKYDFDYVIIAVVDKKKADEIKDFLYSLGIEKQKIIWSNAYSLGAGLFPDNRQMLLNNYDYYEAVIDEMVTSDNIFAGGRYYQGCKEIGLRGSRNNEERIVLYKIPQLLNESMLALDMGCNYGFFDLLAAPYLNNIVGIDIEPAFIRIAEKTAGLLGIDNARFTCRNAFEALKDSHEKYDVIFNLGVYGYILEDNISEMEFAETIMSKLKADGLLFFESHPLTTIDRIKSYKRISSYFKSKMKIISHLFYESIGEREFYIFQLDETG